MNKVLNIDWIKWIHWTWLDNHDILKILNNFDFHELDIEACIERNQRARIDTYDDYMFIVLHFPKYQKSTESYILNEFNVFLWKDFLITLKDYSWTHINSIFKKYDKSDLSIEWVKISTWYILYEIIEAMLEKMFRVCDNIRKDLKILEWEVFENTDRNLVKKIMIKKRNIIRLKHMFLPQIAVMKHLEFSINNFFKWEIEVYFEDLEDKIEKVVNDIRTIEEYTESLEDAFKSIIDIKTNKLITFLTVFSAFMLPLTFITSFYGMNISLPYQEYPSFLYLILIFSILVMFLWAYYVKRKWKF